MSWICVAQSGYLRFFFSSRRRHTRYIGDWSSDVCSSDLAVRKWPHFRTAFRDFSPEKVARLSERDIGALMEDSGIVRNEKKIRATVENAKTILDLAKEHGSVKGYIAGFGKREGKLLEDLQYKFRHMGPATARVFLWSVGYPLTPNEEEKRWMKGHPEHD